MPSFDVAANLQLLPSFDERDSDILFVLLECFLMVVRWELVLYSARQVKMVSTVICCLKGEARQREGNVILKPLKLKERRWDGHMSLNPPKFKRGEERRQEGNMRFKPPNI